MILIETEDGVQRMATRGRVSCPASCYWGGNESWPGRRCGFKVEACQCVSGVRDISVKCGPSRNRAAKIWNAALQQGRIQMPHFICYLNWTDEGAKTVKGIPERYDAAHSLASSLGGKVVEAYVTTGQYDVVTILDMPDGDAMTKYALTLVSRGLARTTTVRAFPIEEISQIVSSLP